MKSQFKVKIIGGRLVHVPDFDYVKEYENGHPKQTARRQNLPESNVNLSQINKKAYSYPGNYVEANGPQNYDDGMPKHMSYKSGSFQYDPNGVDASPLGVNRRRGNYVPPSSSLDQRLVNRLEAERNKRRAQQELYGSTLEADPVSRDRNDVDYNDDVKEIEVEDAALSRQVADCLKHTNKQKLAYALRAMKRLDLTGDGYITVREFRDVLLMYQIFIIGGALEKLIEKYKSNGGKINYIRLWRFVTSSYELVHSPQKSRLLISEETDEERTLRETKMNIQKSLRLYSQKNQETFDFTEIKKSFQHCDRMGTNLMHENEMRIICKHYLPFDLKDLDVLFEECDPQSNGWINYQSFLKILEDGQPTYLPPIKPTRTGTFTLDDKDTITLPPDLGDRKDNGQIEKKDQLTLRQGMKSPESRSQNGVSPRRRWYESEDSWKKRKRRETGQRSRRKPSSRKRWENADPVSSLRGTGKQDSPIPGESDGSDYSFYDLENEPSRVPNENK